MSLLPRHPRLRFLRRVLRQHPLLHRPHQTMGMDRGMNKHKKTVQNLHRFFVSRKNWIHCRRGCENKKYTFLAMILRTKRCEKHFPLSEDFPIIQSRMHPVPSAAANRAKKRRHIASSPICFIPEIFDRLISLLPAEEQYRCFLLYLLPGLPR